MDGDKHSKYQNDIGRTDSGFESTRNSINPSINDSVLESIGKDETYHASIDDAIYSLERTSIIPDDPKFDMVYTHWLVADQNGQIPFHMAIARGEFDVVHNIMQRCRFPYLLDIADGKGLTPLAIAVMQEHADIARALIMYGADVTKLSRGNMPLHTACKMGNATMVDILTKPVDLSFLEANPFLKQLEVDQAYINKINIEGMTALHLAVEAGHRQIVRILVKELGCDVNHRDDKNGDTCLNVLMRNGGNIDLLKYILENDADPNIANRAGYTALHLAAAHALHEAVHVLLMFTTADLGAMTPEEDLAEDLAPSDSSLVKCLQLEMKHRLATAAR